MAPQALNGAALSEDREFQEVAETSKLVAARRLHYGPNSPLFFTTPIQILDGQGCYIRDEKGTVYLDTVNNVCHVGHCHPKVTEAVCAQLKRINTNSRYLHPTQLQYTQKLLSTFPTELETLYLVASGSEANDLALRIATTCNPAARHVAVLAGAYHGHLSSLIPISSYKFWGPGGAGKEPHVHVMPCPDPYRGVNLDGRTAARAAIAAATAAGGRICAFIAESVPSCGGQIILPPGYLQAVYEEMHAVGAVCIADEVQCGFGRAGSSFWAFESQGVVPDMVSLGKPMGNGYPIAGLVLRRHLARGFANGMDYFSTFGGSTAAVAAGLATLSVIQEVGLQQHALKVGEYLMSQLRELAGGYPFIGDVRGQGLMVGLDLVRDTTSKAPAPRLASWLKERLRHRRVLLSTDGPYDNVLKLKPPLVFGVKEADLVVSALRAVLEEELTGWQWAALQQEEEEHMRNHLAQLMAKYKDNEAFMYSLVGDQAAPAEAVAGRGDRTPSTSAVKEGVGRVNGPPSALTIRTAGKGLLIGGGLGAAAGPALLAAAAAVSKL